MTTLDKSELQSALTELGQLAQAQGLNIELVVVGGAAMVLAYSARLSTRDVDVAILSPKEARLVRELARQIANKRRWPEDWLNDGAKGYLVGISQGQIVFSAPGIEVRIPEVTQLLAMKLCAWRDDVDVADARLLLQQISPSAGRDSVWQKVAPYLVPGRELKAQYAFSDLWESLYGDN